MVCMYCAGETSVINSRHQKRTNTVWRRRRCNTCGATITTEEAPRYETALMVELPDGTLQPFSREILLISLYKSLAHRKTATDDATALTGTLLATLRQQSQTNAVIDQDQLIQHVLTILERFDAAAAAHYRAYHPLPNSR